MRFLALACLVGLALTSPIFHTDTFIPGTSIKLSEASPWHITQFTVFEATPEAQASKNCSSYISFHFEDVNKGLALNTTCTRTVGAGESPTTTKYQSCENDFVNFIYSGDSLQVEHLYHDASIGDPPYDGAIAFGNTSLNCTKTKVEDGVFMTQAHMMIRITSTIG